MSQVNTEVKSDDIGNLSHDALNHLIKIIMLQSFYLHTPIKQC